MYTEDELNAAFEKVLSNYYEKIPYTQEGFDWLLKAVKKIIPEKKMVISIQSIEEMSAQDIAERKLPKFIVTYTNEHI